MAREYFKQKCWHCRYATNRNLCPWVRKQKLPKGAQKNATGYIVECPLYEWDGMTETRTAKQIAHDLGMTYNAYIHNRTKARAYTTFLQLLKQFDYETVAKMLEVDAKIIEKWKKKRQITSQKYVTKLTKLRKVVLKDE